MSKTFIESIIPFITSMRKGISDEGGSTPKFIKFNNGDNFIDFHFDTTSTPTKDDFDLVTMEGELFSVIAGFEWHQKDGNIKYDGFAVEVIPEGTEMEGEVLKGDFFTIIDFEGYGIYYNDIAAEYMSKDGEVIEPGWKTDSFRYFAKNIRQSFDLDEGCYGTMIDALGGMDANYDQEANGKIYGFLDGDIKQ